MRALLFLTAFSFFLAPASAAVVYYDVVGVANPYVTVTGTAGLVFNSNLTEATVRIQAKEGETITFRQTAASPAVMRNFSVSIPSPQGNIIIPSSSLVVNSSNAFVQIPIGGLPSCFEVRPDNIANGIEIRLIYKAMCQACGQPYFLRLDFGRTSTPLVDYVLLIPVSIPCHANVVLITDTSKLGSGDFGRYYYSSVFDDYLAYLKSEGLTYRYVNLNNSDTFISFGFYYPNPLPSMSSSEASKRLVRPIRRILEKTRSKYLLILGGASVIPMPFEDDHQPAPGTEYPFFTSVEGKLPSDDLYSMAQDDVLPSVIVSRFPTPYPSGSSGTASRRAITAMMSFRHDVSTAARFISLDDVLIVGDACGSAEECYLDEEVNLVSQTIFGGDCSQQSGRCKFVPRFCNQASAGGSCEPPRRPGISVPNTLWTVATNKAAVMILHGDGLRFVGIGSSGGNEVQYRVLSNQDLDTHAISENEPFTYAPAFFSNSCYNGAIDVSPNSEWIREYWLAPPTREDRTIALALANAGARAIVGRTRFGFQGEQEYYSFMNRFFSQRDKNLGQHYLAFKKDGYGERQSFAENTIEQLELETGRLEAEIASLGRLRPKFVHASAAEIAEALEQEISREDVNWWLSVKLQYYVDKWQAECGGDSDCIVGKLDALVEEDEETMFFNEMEADEIRDNPGEAVSLIDVGDPLEAHHLRRLSNIETVVLYGDPLQTASG
ncbi:MAG: hypothetical protein AB1626_03370 [Candidatus Micrarchaeota archaeon]